MSIINPYISGLNHVKHTHHKRTQERTRTNLTIVGGNENIVIGGKSSRQFIACQNIRILHLNLFSVVFFFQRLINMHIYDNQLYAKVEDLNV